MLKLEEIGDTPKRGRSKQKEAGGVIDTGTPEQSEKKALKKKLTQLYNCVAECKVCGS